MGGKRKLGLKKEEEDEECGLRLEVWWLLFVPGPELSSASIEAAWKTRADGRLLLLPYYLRAMH